ncbi:hypothetical protein GCM10011608_12350 [Micromonospora sonchi]|uniref:Histidine kinase/HSP90-like ATPase domain-containing protein n=1 Tax=Micromonospora sonchi TaxID=1763543 RepID=A0A917TN03_9ACTN|nr:ATP-binding protein [Micromonospora sonchi]GGM29180.1 hypothetical protein GCM10011608_12350 [Micromonospora sonchi]
MGELTAHVDLPMEPPALAAARQMVRTVLSVWGFRDPDWVDDAVLVAVELVGNAVRHGNGRLELRVSAEGDQVTISAVDGSAVVPRRRPVDSDGGRGLGIIEALLQAWGVEEYHGGKLVWIRLTPPSPQPGLTTGER